MPAKSASLNRCLMKNLLELFHIVRKGNPDKIELLDKTLLNNKGDTKFAQLYEGLASGKIKSDLEASQFIYQSSETDVKYRQLKSRFRKRLLNTLLLIDPLPFEKDENKEAYLQAEKQWMLIQIARRHQARQVVDSMARNLMNFCLKRQFHQLAFRTAHLLWTRAVQQNQQKKAEKYLKIREEQLGFCRAEEEAETCYLRHLSAFKAQQKAPDIEKAVSRLIELADQYPSADVYFYMFGLSVLYYHYDRQYQGMAQVCRQAVQQLRKFPHWPCHHQIIEFYLEEMLAYWALGKPEAAAQLTGKVLDEFEQDPVKKIKFMELYFLTAMHSKNYQRAKSIYKKVTEQSLELDQTLDDKEKWRLFEAYLCFVDIYCREDKDASHKINQVKKKLPVQLNKHLRKQWDIIFHLLQIAQKQDVDPAFFKNISISPQEKNPSKRRKLFLKLLERLHLANYRGDKLRLAEKYYIQLRTTPLTYCTQPQHLEIIPYEHLWEMIIEHLEITSW